MTHRTWNIDHGPLRGFYRDRENGWIFGVCAGIADRFNLQLGAVVYLLAAFLIREKPLIYSGRASEQEFWCRRRDYWRHS